MIYQFKCFDYSHQTHQWGIEYALDEEGENITDVQWFETQEQRDAAFNSADRSL